MAQAILKNHMDIYWHDYASAEANVPITQAGLIEKASVIGRTGLMMLSCGTGAWRVRSSMNTLSKELGVTTTADIGLMSIEYTCFDGDDCFTQSLCLTNTGAVANTVRLELVDLAGFPPAAAAFLGALLAGLLASMLKSVSGYPRISVTVPAIGIMVPGLYMYRAFYNLGIMSLNASATWFAQALLIILALPLGLIFARVITDKTFRYCT